MAAAAGNIFSELEAAVATVTAKKAALDKLTDQVEAAAAAHQEAVKAAEAIHKTFQAAIGQHVPSARSR